MARRTQTNETGIERIPSEHSVHDAWCAYICVNCNHLNYVHIGEHLLTPEQALETQQWECKECGYVHSKDSDLPEKLTNWKPELLEKESVTAQRFWKAFFVTAAENAEAYWKKCNMCGRILPNHAFSKHKGWGPLEKQMECRACKGAINSILNDLRTTEQLRESSIRRRIADLFVADQNETINVSELFERFGGKCFKTGKLLDISKTGSWHIDHILPSKYLYPLTVRNAALLSAEANSNKRDRWPSEFYTNQELIELARVTGAPLALMASTTPVVNTNIDVNKGIDKYLTVRNSSDLPKRIIELKRILALYHLEDLVDDEHQRILYDIL
ncbi:hypothetical protein [uncultured Alistipes sp.]|uniref:hypothetical protein n=1 Tax=uncultured Alistipes sp. TaxID=538949 RepID=UPI002729C69A|nr:hypothetical protein [uncultured Alistipes sp.]